MTLHQASFTMYNQVYNSKDALIPNLITTVWTLCSGNADGHKDNLAPENYDAFVDYLTEVVGYYRHEMNFTFRTVEPFNEPFSWNWHAGNDQEGCHYDPSTQDIVLQVYIYFDRVLVGTVSTASGTVCVHVCV